MGERVLPAMAPGMDENHETFARMCAGALSAWDDAQDWQRRAIEAILSPLATALYGASLAVDAMLDDEPEQAVPQDRPGWGIGPAEQPTTCREMVAIPTHGNSYAAKRGETTQYVTCGRSLVNGKCPVCERLTAPTADLGRHP